MKDSITGLLISIAAVCGLNASTDPGASETPKPPMFFGDTSRLGASRPFAKDPSVVRFQERYFLYYSIPPGTQPTNNGWGIGIATSDDLTHWKVAGHMGQNGEHPGEARGFAAPGAIILNGKVHLFYQTYPEFPSKILHAWSTDGIHFTRDPGNPVFQAPVTRWSNGRAIDAEVFEFDGSLYLYFASRNATNYPVAGTPGSTIQLLGVASTPLRANSDYAGAIWKSLSLDAPILEPELAWEQKCIEAPTIVQRDGKLFMFYAGAYNNEPQQIGVAVSTNALTWTRLPSLRGHPFLANGPPGSWNSSESGHPGVFLDKDGQTYLFFQGNNDRGKTWYLTWQKITWTKEGPALEP